MDCKSLMIGDWVLLWNKPQRVNYIILDDGERIGTDKQYLAQIVEAFEPIPLTAEILEKIGLRKITLDGEKGSKQDYYIDTHIVGYYNMDALTRVHASPIVYDIKQKWLFVDDKQVCRIELMCPYVHTLQHALRLCGIDKEIVL